MASNESALLKSGARLLVDPNVIPKRIQPKSPNPIYKCSCCGKEYKVQKDNFPPSFSILYAGNDGYLNFCKTCVTRYYMQMLDLYADNAEQAVEHCCWVFDYYYSKDIFDSVANSSSNISMILNYITKTRTAQNKARGTSYIDTMKDRYTGRIMSIDDLDVKMNVDDSNTIVSDTPRTDEDTIMFFGFGFTDDEYAYLSTQYQDWTARYECQTKAQEELFKGLCIAQLTIQRAQASGNTKAVADAMKTFQDLLGTANLKPSQNNDSALADQNTFGTLIRKWENDRPISEPEEEWKDVDGIKKMIRTFFLGHLANLVHVQNDAEEEYRQEMAKYTVKPPTYDFDAELGDTNILDKYSDKQQGGVE